MNDKIAEPKEKDVKNRKKSLIS